MLRTFRGSSPATDERPISTPPAKPNLRVHGAADNRGSPAAARGRMPITKGRLDLGPWQAVFYCEFDGGRPKRMVIKVLGE